MTISPNIKTLTRVLKQTEVEIILSQICKHSRHVVIKSKSSARPIYVAPD